MQNKNVDVLIRDASVIDGSGRDRFKASVAVRDDRIVAIGDLADYQAGLTLDGAGKVLAPGFIDAHCHDDHALFSMPLLEPKVTQGVTTVVNGNCGISLAPMPMDKGHPPQPISLLSHRDTDYFASFDEYFERLDNEPPAVNSVCLTGHTSLRFGAMENLSLAASPAELTRMQRQFERALDAGSIGLSTGTYYPPAQAAPTEELESLVAMMTGRGGVYVTHMRDEADHIADSLNETFRIGRHGDVPVIVSHHKCVGADNHGRSVETLAMIEETRKTQTVGLDAYPYIASSTMLEAARLGYASRVIVSWSETMPQYSGRDLDDIARELACSPAEAVAQLEPAGATYFMLDETDVRRILSYPHTMIGSDGICEDRHPHPRAWGTFPRVLGHYARDTKLFSLEEAVRKMTSLTAERFGLRDRGTIKVGGFADLVLFDADTVIDTADFDKPKTPAAGIEKVLVNGRLVYADQEHTGQRPGRAIRRSHA